MRRFVNRGTVFLVMLALLAGMLPGAQAQETAAELNMPATAEGKQADTQTTEEPSETDTPTVGEDVDEPTVGEEETETPVEEEPVLTQVGTFSEGMVRVTDGTYWGYASTDGTVQIPVQFDAAEDFELGVAKVTKDGYVGLLHWSGSFLFLPVYDELNSIGYGLYLGCRSQRWDLMSVSSVDGGDHYLYYDLEDARVTEGVNGQLILQEQGGKTTRVLLRNLPQWLKSKNVSGWQFPLHTSERATFVDVTGPEWYDRWVNLAYSTGMMEGVGDQKFAPRKELTVAETLRLAACLESRAIQDDFHLQNVGGAHWYSSSVTYCETVGIISHGEYGKDDFNRPVTRAEMARIFGKTTAVRSMKMINDPERVRDAIPDVKEGDYGAEAIFGLFAKGVFNGKDSACSFCPNENLTRAEAAAVIVRITRPEHRIVLWQEQQ